MTPVGRHEERERAVSTLAAGRSAVVLGEPGAGRSSFMRWIASDPGLTRTAAFIAGRDSGAGAPLAPAAPLMAEVPVDPQAGLAIYTALPTHLRDTGRVLIVDDADHLDRATDVLLVQCLRAGIPLLVAAESLAGLGHGLRDALEARAPAIIRLPLLTPDDVLAVAAARCGDPLDAASSARLVNAGHGNPARITELINGGLEAARRTDQGVALGERLLTEPLRAAVLGAFGAVGEAVRDQIGFVIACGRVPEAVLEPEWAETALSSGLLVVRRHDGVEVVEPVDAVQAAAIGESLGPTRLRTLKERALHRARAAAPTNGPERAQLAAFAALLAVEVGLAVPVTELFAALRWNLDHHRLVEVATLLDVISEETVDDVGLMVVRGRALASLGDFVAAERELTAALTRGDDDVVVSVAGELGRLHAVRLGDPVRAVEVVEQILPALPPERGNPLRADLVKWRSMAGMPTGEGPGSFLAGADGEWDSWDRVSVGLIEAMMASLDGPVAAAQRAVDQTARYLESSEIAPPHARDLLELSQFLAFVAQGAITRADALARERRNQAVATAHPSLGMWEFASGELCLHRGDYEAALRLAHRAARHLVWQDFTGLLEASRALAAAAAAACGRSRLSRAWAAEVPVEGRADVKVDLHLSRAEAWGAVRAGDRGTASDLLTRAGLKAMAEGHTHLGLIAVDEALVAASDRRRRRRCAEVLVANAHRSDLFATLAAHAQALVAEDARSIERCAGRFRDLGLGGRARAAYAAAAQLQDQRGAREAVRRLERLATSGTAPGAAVIGATSTSLTLREAQVARLAMSRGRSREIADELGLSIRTVDNHLSRAFRKLGIVGRDELAQALADQLD